MKITTTRSPAFGFTRSLVHGDSGIGKTTSLATLPVESTLIAGAERGLLPLREKDFMAVKIESWTDIRELVAMLSASTTVDGREIKVLAIDSLSECNELCKRHILEVDRKALTMERTKGKTDKTGGIYDDQMTMEDWGILGTRMTNFISAVCHLPMQIIFTSLSTWSEDKITGATHRTPALQGRLAQSCPAFFDFVFHMEAAVDSEGGATRVWRTFNDGRIMAKDASGKLDPFEPASWKHIFKKVLGTKNGNGKAVETKTETKSEKAEA